MNEQLLGQLSGGGSSHYFALPAGSKLFEFEIASVLGHGGFGITYLATDTLLQETVALKEFFPNELAVRVTDATVRAKSDDEQPDFVAGLKAFLEEARLMARFRHRNIVQVRRFFELHGTGYIVQDYEQGQTLSKRLSNGPIGETELRRLLGGVLDGLEAVHERAILHRDLKPDNIILRGDGTPVLIDFGAARDFAGRHSRSITAIAAGGYTPPEQWGVGGQQGPWSDLYALGAIAYRCVTGTAPPISLQRLRSDPLVPATIAAAGKYDPALLSTIDWMLTIDEAKRPASVQAVRDALAGGSAPPRADAPHATGSLTITAAGSGEATLAFEQKISADVLELAFFVEPPGQYLTPSTDDKESWGKEPHYFSLYRSTDAHGQAQFTTEADMAAHIVSGARVTVSSKDGFIRASATWPDIATKLPKRSRARQWLIAAGILIAASIAAGGYQFYRIEQQHREAERQRLIQQLQVAGYDRGAIEQLQGSCGTSCPLDIKAQAQSRLDLIAAEERTYQAAQNDANKLRAYVHDCQACNFKPDAEQQIKRLDEQRQAAERALEKQRQAAEHARLAASLAQAGNDLAALQRFLTECGSTCPPDLRTQAQNLIASEQQREAALAEHRRLAQQLDSAKYDRTAINTFLAACGFCPIDLRSEAERRLGAIAVEDARYLAAGNDAEKLRAYSRTCEACNFKSEADARADQIEAHQPTQVFSGFVVPDMGPITQSPPRPQSTTEVCATFRKSSDADLYCASSVLAPEFGNTYVVQNLFSSNNATAWVHGTHRVGTGQWIVVQFDGIRLVRSFTIRNGYQKNSDIYKKNSRVRRLRLVFSQGESKTVLLEDRFGDQTVDMTPPIRAYWIQFVIEDVFRGSKYPDTAISKLFVASDPVQ